MFYANAEDRYAAEDEARAEAAASVAADMEAFARSEANDPWADWGDEADVYASIDAAEEAA